MTFPLPQILAPHDPPMLLVDTIVSRTEDAIVSKMTITRDNIFYVAGRGVPGYVGFEIMAQTIAVRDGLQRSMRGEGPRIGFLLGCRKYSVEKDWFQVGDELIITAKALIAEGEMGSFDCTIEDVWGGRLAHGCINVFSPHNLEDFIKQGGSSQ